MKTFTRNSFVLFLVFLFLGVLDVQAAPVVKVEQKVFDAGVISQGAAIEHDFSFTNTGDEPLKLTPKHC